MPNEQKDPVKESQEQKYVPPLVIRMAFCATCGQNNLVRPLKDKHYSGGKLCTGVLTIIGYSRNELKAMHDEGARLFAEGELEELNEIRDCDKCDLCEDHHA